MSLYSKESHSNRFILSSVCVVFVLKQLSVCVWTLFAPKYLIKITHPGVLQKHDTIKYPSSDIDIGSRRKYELLKQYIRRVERMLNSFHFRQHTFLASFPSELLLPIVSRLFSAVRRLVVCCIPQTSPSVIGRGVNGTITRTKHGPIHLFQEIAILEFPTSDCFQNEAICDNKLTAAAGPVGNTWWRTERRNKLLDRATGPCWLENYNCPAI